VNQEGSPNKKAGLPYILQVAARLSHPETRGFPPPPRGGFGFIGRVQLPAERPNCFQLITANNMPDPKKKRTIINFVILLYG